LNRWQAITSRFISVSLVGSGLRQLVLEVLETLHVGLDPVDRAFIGAGEGHAIEVSREIHAMGAAEVAELDEEGFGRLVHLSSPCFRSCTQYRLDSAPGQALEKPCQIRGLQSIRAVALIGLRAEHVTPGEILGRRLPGGSLQDVTHLELAHVLRHDEGVGGAVRARGPVPISHHHAQVLGPRLEGDRHVVAGHVGRCGALLLQRIGVGRQREVEVVRGGEGLGHLCLLDPFRPTPGG
jgi:hypothetical protein